MNPTPLNITVQASLLQVKEDLELGVTVAGLREVYVDTVEKVRSLLAKGASRRQTGGTRLNENSSRSHTIFRIVIESRERVDRGGEAGAARISMLSFVDLAGSERLSKSGAEGTRAEETAQINLRCVLK
jgi:centromeric protein E